MTMLNKNSLVQTLDNLNDAFFYGKKISKSEAKEITGWISSRLDTPYSYNRSFGITKKDMQNPVYTFTGERLTSPASMRHIMAEEACRVLVKLSHITGKPVPALKESDKRFLKMLEDSEKAGKPKGTFCCGACTVGLWRHLSAGGLSEYSAKLPEGILVLHYNHDANGRWGRFPFFYTLLALSEIDDPIARKELNYAQTECERTLSKLRKTGKFSKRKYDLLLKVLN